MSVQIPQLAGFLLTKNCSNFFYVEGSTAWLYDCPHFFSPLYKDDRCFNRIPIRFKEIIMDGDPITRQSNDYATPIACDKNPRNTIELDLTLLIKIFTFLDQNLLKENRHSCSYHLKSKLQYALILSQLKMLEDILMPT